MIKKWVAHEAAHDWPVLLGWASAGTVVVVALSRLVQAYAIDAQAVIAIGVVGLVAVAALACLAGLIWASWGIRRTEQDAAPFFVALGISLAAIGVCTEAFAGVTTLLWRYGVLSAGGEPGLWRTEEYYLWHLVDSVPLLDIQEGFQWPEPLVFSGAGGGLLLAYKIFLIAPLLRIAIGTYQGLTKRFLEREAKKADLVRRNVLIPRWRPVLLKPARTPRRFTDLLRLLLLPLMPAVPVLVGLLLMPLVFEPGSGLDAKVSGWLGHGNLAFLRTAPQWAAAALLLGLVGSLMGELLESEPVRRGVDVATTVALWLATISWVIVAAAAVNLALLHVGLAALDQPLAPVDQVRTTVSGYAWHIAAALPGPDIPGTLHWAAPPGYTDRWSSLLILLSKAVIVGVLVAPVALAILSYELHSRPRPARPALGAAAEFAQAYAMARAAVDRVTTTTAFNREINAEYHARQAANVVVAKLDGVLTLFGPGDVSRRADAAVGALNRRLDDPPSFDHDLEGHRRLRKEERQLFTAYRRAASHELRSAADDARSPALSRPQEPA